MTQDISPHEWKLGDHHVFETGKMALVCRNTFNVLYQTQFVDHLTFYGSKPTTHYGIFEGCGQHLPFDKVDQKNSNGSCC